MDLHAEGLLILLLRGGGGVDDCSVHDGSFGESQTLLLEVGVDFRKRSSPGSVNHEKMPKLADGGLVGDRLVPEVDSDEAPHGFHIVEGCELRSG